VPVVAGTALLLNGMLRTPPAAAAPPAPRATPGTAPDDAVKTVEAFASSDVTTFRASLSSVTLAAAPDAVPPPPGTTVTIDRGSWRQRGDDAVVRVTGLDSDGKDVPTDVYLVREAGRWRVLFTADAS
jgi:hypothetical protein